MQTEQPIDVGAHSSPSPWPKLRSAVGTLSLALLAIALVAAALAVNVWHLKFETVLSGSMRPSIQPGDVVVLRPVPVDTIAVGDVIAYLPPQQQRPVLHRVVEMDDSGILTQGDANNVADPWGRVKPEGESVDELVMSIPKIGFLRNAKGLIVIGGLALLIAAGAIALWPRKKKSDAAADEDSTVDDAGAEAEEVQLDGAGAPVPAVVLAHNAEQADTPGLRADEAWRDPHTETSEAAASEHETTITHQARSRTARRAVTRRKGAQHDEAWASNHAMATIAPATTEDSASGHAVHTNNSPTERVEK